MKQIIKMTSLVAIIALAGCGTDHHITRAESMKNTERGNGVIRYAGQIRDAVISQIYSPEQYTGKRCTVRMHQARDGMIISARSEGGDPAFCQVALLAVQHAKIPPAPSDEVYQIFRNVPLDFQL